MNPSDTPRTDEREKVYWETPTSHVDEVWEFAREMERENAALRDALPKPDKQGVLFGTTWLSYDKILGLETEDETVRAEFYRGSIPIGFVQWAQKARAAIDAARKEAQP